MDGGEGEGGGRIAKGRRWCHTAVGATLLLTIAGGLFAPLVQNSHVAEVAKVTLEQPIDAEDSKGAVRGPAALRSRHAAGSVMPVASPLHPAMAVEQTQALPGELLVPKPMTRGAEAEVEVFDNGFASAAAIAQSAAAAGAAASAARVAPAAEAVEAAQAVPAVPAAASAASAASAAAAAAAVEAAPVSPVVPVAPATPVAAAPTINPVPATAQTQGNGVSTGKVVESPLARIRHYDTDGNGRLSRDEVGKYAKNELGSDIPAASIEHVCKELFRGSRGLRLDDASLLEQLATELQAALVEARQGKQGLAEDHEPKRKVEHGKGDVERKKSEQEGHNKEKRERESRDKEERERKKREQDMIHYYAPVGEPCGLELCILHGMAAPRLFVQEHIDGAGHRMANIINGIACASKNKMNFGGIVGVPNTKTEQGSDFRKLVDGLFGNGASKQLFFSSNRTKTRSKEYFAVQHHPRFAAEYKSLQLLEKERDSFADSANVFLPSANGVTLTGYFTGALLDKLRRRMMDAPLQFSAGAVAVAVHVRRGDLKPGDYRATPNEYYYRLVDRIHGHLPSAEYHLWSSTKNIEAFKDKPLWKSSDFDGFRSRGIHVHLDDDDLIDPWTHLARAQVFVMSRSSFSYVPAALNPNCVLYPGSMSNIHENWVNAMDVGKKSFDEGLRRCLMRIGLGGLLKEEGGAELP